MTGTHASVELLDEAAMWCTDHHHYSAANLLEHWSLAATLDPGVFGAPTAHTPLRNTTHETEI